MPTRSTCASLTAPRSPWRRTARLRRRATLPRARRRPGPRRRSGEEWSMAEPPLRVLIVDDEAPARRRLRDLLDDCAAALPLAVVGEAGDGQEAIDLLQATTSDLVLTDIHMPGMDGIELARHLLKLAQPPVVIFTTAYNEHAVQAFDVSAVDYLMKPVRMQRL